MVSPSRRRDAVTYLSRRHRVSQRRACQLVGQHRSTQRYEGQPPDFELRLTKRMNELAAKHPRFGYRRIWALLRSEGFEVNHKRVERLWRLEGHRVPPQRRTHGQKAVGGSAFGTWAIQAGAPNDVWSYDFVSARTDDGQQLRILNVVDEFTRRCLGCRVARNIGARDLIDELGSLFEQHGMPKRIRSDNGREFISETLADWLKERHVEQLFIAKGSPQQNAYVERFNGSMRDEVLNGELFRTVLEAKVVLHAWVEQYNTVRPHRGLGFQTPQAFYTGIRVGSQ
jgi:transposase InsO family protein